MPIHRFVCSACGHDFEELVFRDERVSCPSCAATEVERRFSAFAIPKGARAPAGPGVPGACGTCGDPRGPGACAED